MATNSYFSKFHVQEKLIVEDMVAECIKIQGLDVFYLPRKFQKLDPVFGEDVLSKFDVALPIEIYIDSFSGFGGEREILTKFGLQINDQLTIQISRRTFKYAVGRYGKNQTSNRPTEGDLIYLPMTKQLFEIRFCNNDDPFYQLGQVNVFRVTLETFQYNREEIATGIDEIDIIAELNNIDRIHWALTDETGNRLITEEGSPIISQNYQSEGTRDFDNTPDFEKQNIDFDVLNFDEDDPFSEKF
jgi:hypothetical protein